MTSRIDLKSAVFGDFERIFHPLADDGSKFFSNMEDLVTDMGADIKVFLQSDEGPIDWKNLQEE